MREPAERKLPRESVKRRQTEIERCLAEFGLTRGPRRLLHGARLTDEDAHCHRLRACLVRLGPVFSYFGIWLSSRVDLLAADYCIELSSIPDRAQATPIAAVRELIRGSLGRSLEEVWQAFEDEPFESRILFQSHRALLNSGKAVTVKIIHPELQEQLCDLELLPFLRGVFADLELSDRQFGDAIADFRSTLDRHLNFIHEARALEAYIHDSKELEMLNAPAIYKGLCSPEMLTIERLPGIGLNDVVPSLGKPDDEESFRASAALASLEIEPVDLARSLCIAWLGQALLGRSFPIEPRPETIVLLPDGKIAFTSGLFASVPSETKTNLLNYLISAAAEDADKACSYLLKEMGKEKGATSEEDLQHRFRQVVPFRDGGWSDEGKSDSLAEHLFAHWRLASHLGYKPTIYLLDFFRGLFLISATARRLALHRDPLMEALDDIRLRMMLGQFRQMMSLGEVGSNLDKYAAMMMELPQKLDDVLTLAAEGKALLKLQVTDAANRRRQGNTAAVVTALLMTLAASILLSRHLARSAVARDWVEGGSAFVFVMLSALLLRVVSRR